MTTGMGMTPRTGMRLHTAMATIMATTTTHTVMTPIMGMGMGAKRPITNRRTLTTSTRGQLDRLPPSSN